jgi:hypothetical protein
MEENLSTCFEKLGISHRSGFIYGGITSLHILKALDDDEISLVFDSIAKCNSFCFPYTLIRRVKLLAYYLRHLDRVQREFNLDSVTLEKLEEMKVLKDL